MAEKVVSLKDFAHVKATSKNLSLEDVENMPLTITKIDIRKGDYGKFAVFTATTSEGALVTVRTTSKSIVTALDEAGKAEALPVQATFKYGDNGWVIE